MEDLRVLIGVVSRCSTFAPEYFMMQVLFTVDHGMTVTDSSVDLSRAGVILFEFNLGIPVGIPVWKLYEWLNF